MTFAHLLGFFSSWTKSGLFSAGDAGTEDAGLDSDDPAGPELTAAVIHKTHTQVSHTQVSHTRSRKLFLQKFSSFLNLASHQQTRTSPVLILVLQNLNLLLVGVSQPSNIKRNDLTQVFLVALDEKSTFQRINTWITSATDKHGFHLFSIFGRNNSLWDSKLHVRLTLDSAE